MAVSRPSRFECDHDPIQCYRQSRPRSPRGPFVFWDDLPAACRKAAELGFDAVEILPPSADAIAANAVRKLLADNDLGLAAVGTGAGWVKHKLHLRPPDATARTQAKVFIRSIIDVAGSLGAGDHRVDAGLVRRRVDRPTAVAWFADALNELGDYANQYNVPLIYEPLNRYETNLCNTVGAGVELLDSLRTSNVLLLADLFHMNIEEANVADALRGGGKRIGHVHFVDSNRRPAGMGYLNYPPIAVALIDIDYRGYASAQAFAYPDPDAAAKQTIDAFRKYFR